MEKKNNSGLLVGIIIGLVIAAIIGIALYSSGTISLKSETKDKQNNNQQEKETTKITTISDVVGEYRTEVTNLKAEDPSNSKGTAQLMLYNNGIFTYIFSQYAPHGTLGNYIVKENEIILTAWFSTSSSPELAVVSGTKSLTITEEKAIIDNDVSYKELNDNNITTITLTKTDKEISSFDPGNRMAVACLNPRDDGSCGQEPTNPFNIK